MERREYREIETQRERDTERKYSGDKRGGRAEREKQKQKEGEGGICFNPSALYPSVQKRFTSEPKQAKQQMKCNSLCLILKQAILR